MYTSATAYSPFKNNHSLALMSIQMSFIGLRKHTFTLPKQVSKRKENKNNKKTVVGNIREHNIIYRGKYIPVTDMISFDKVQHLNTSV